MNTVNPYSDDPMRTADEGSLLHEQPKRLSDPDDKSGWNNGRYSGELLADCDAAWEARKARIEANAAEARAVEKTLKARALQAHSCRVYAVAGICTVCEKRFDQKIPTIGDLMENMMDASEKFFSATDAMFAPRHKK